jgi:hypothetical protein
MKYLYRARYRYGCISGSNAKETTERQEEDLRHLALLALP